MAEPIECWGPRAAPLPGPRQWPLPARPLFRYLAFSTFDTSPTIMQGLLRQHSLTMLGANFGGTPLPAPLDRLSALGTLINILARRDD